MSQTGGLDPYNHGLQGGVRVDGSGEFTPAFTGGLQPPEPAAAPTPAPPVPVPAGVPYENMQSKFRNMTPEQVSNLFHQTKNEGEVAGLMRFFKGLGTNSSGYNNAKNWINKYKFGGDQLEANRFTNYWDEANYTATPRFDSTKGTFTYDDDRYDFDKMSYQHHASNFWKGGDNPTSRTRNIDGWDNMFTNTSLNPGNPYTNPGQVAMQNAWTGFGTPPHGYNVNTGESTSPFGNTPGFNTGMGAQTKIDPMQSRTPVPDMAAPNTPVPVPTAPAIPSTVSPTIAAPRAQPKAFSFRAKGWNV